MFSLFSPFKKDNQDIQKKNNNKRSIPNLIPKDIPRKDQIFLNKIINNDLTMTSANNVLATYFSAISILKNNVDGDFIETGTWAGGHSIIIGYLLKKFKSNKKIFIFDTFTGMPNPMKDEVRISDNVSAKSIIDESQFNKCKVDLSSVIKNIKMMNLELDNFNFIKGKTQKTLKKYSSLKNISFARIDTDWYESTKAEIEFIWPKLSKNGVLIVDDYGYWSGQKKAIDEYFKINSDKKIIHYIDYGTRLFMKI